MFLYGIIVPVIPFALEGRTHVKSDKVQYWVSVLIAVYGAALLAFSPICGWLADHTSSRRSPLLLGLAALLGSTVLLNVAPNVAVLIVARILQGASAAVVWVVGLALMADTVPQENLGQAFGYVGMGMSLGILVAPLLGGIVFERAGYDAVFAMAYALIGLDIVLRLALVEKKVAGRWNPVQAPGDENGRGGGVENLEEREGDIRDLAGTSTSAPGREKSPSSPTLQAPISQNHTHTHTHTLTPSPTPSHPPQQAKRPLRTRLPPLVSLLYSRRLLSALFGALIQAALMTSFDSVLALRAANIFHWHSTGAALLFLPLVIPSFIEPLVGYITDRIGPRYPAAFGFLLAVPPFVCLRYVTDNTIRDKVLICALLGIIGLALALTFPPFMAEISAVVAGKQAKMLEKGEKGYGEGGAYAQAYGLFNMAFAGGCLVGPLLAGFVVENRGWGTMSWVLGLLAGVTAIPTFLWMGGWIGDARKKKPAEGSGERDA
ncbi:MFS general substrate transporter [Delitschia confertaspora ATCC 74209]|uniref:MFS general substrate transporter n=1 Tax=Delitschia confertaspora ATCC 74209 TaxID=1513339 RepID=A0A9P4MS97_9PLEO|nr:MFS general substrate transporter [Delitschia confertaspora ATCC 74209]